MRRALLVLPLLLLPACGDDEPPVSRAASVPSATASAPPSPTTPPAPATPGPVPEPTPQADRSPAGDRAVPAPPGDVDGDGEPDLVTLDEALAVELSGDGRTVTSAFTTDTPPVVAGAEDVDRDGRAEVFVRTARGASTTFLTPFRYDGEVLAPLTLDGQQALLGFGGSAVQGEGFSCTDDGQLVVRSARRQDDGTWELSTTTYDVVGHVLTGVDATDEAGVAEDDPRVGGSYLVDCRSVGEGE